MITSEVRRVIEQVSRDRGVDKQVLIKTLEDALEFAVRKKFGTGLDIEVRYNEEVGEIEVFQFRDVVEEVTEPDLEIDFEESRKLDPECELGDSIGTKMDATTFGRIAAQSAKQIIIQKMKDAERDVVYESFINRKGETINGIVQRIHRGDIIVNLGRTEAVLPAREKIAKETYRRGDRIRAYILDVLQDSRGPQIVLSRRHPQFLISLFSTEVPEISEGIVNIMAAAREPGNRAKIAVTSNDSDIDPVGACVGMKGTRVQSVVHELKGERIDIIPWRSDPAKFVCNALSPAEISRVVVDEANRLMEVIVPDEYLSVAIGKRGQNVRLASKLTGWNINVKSETAYSDAMQSGYGSLMGLPGVGDSTADVLYEQGFYSIEELAKASVEELIQIKGISEKKAQILLESAMQAVEEKEEGNGTTREEDDGMSGEEDNGTTGEEDDDMTGEKDDGMTGEEGNGTTGEEGNGTTGEEDDGTTGEEDDGMTGEEDDGTTREEDDGTTGEKDYCTEKEEDNCESMADQGSTEDATDEVC